MARVRSDRSGVRITLGSAKVLADTVARVRAMRPEAPPMRGGRLDLQMTHAISITPSYWTKRSWMRLEVYAGEPTAEQPTGWFIDAWNPYTNIPAGKEVMVAMVAGNWRVCTGECD